jgi:NAD(P)-dependent dehydrogenase (short-subunit alcohol dehydrogenase family)
MIDRSLAGHDRKSGPVIVTGCSSGIGLATALRLAGSGYRVVATVRDRSRSEGLRQQAADANAVLEIEQLDVTDDESARRCIEAVLDRHGSLYALINNAGTAHLAVFESEPLDEFRGVVETNLFGVVRMTKLALPHLRASRGRLIAVSSVGGVVGQPFNEAYCAAKFAVEGVYETLAPVARRMGVHVSVVEPGPVATNLTSNVDIAALLAGAGPYRSTLESFLATGSRADVDHPYREGQTPQQIAELLVKILQDPRPRFRYPTSTNAEHFMRYKLADVDGQAVQTLVDGWLA